MRKLLSTRYSAGAFNAAMLFLRIITGGLIMHAGYFKLIHFSELQNGTGMAAGHPFMNWIGLGATTSLALVVFAEFFCGLFILIGLFTRFAAIPLIIVMCVIIFQVSKGDVFGEAQMATLFLGGFLTLLFVGPGRVSVDSMIGK